MNDAFHENIGRVTGCPSAGRRVVKTVTKNSGGVATEAGTKHCAKPKKSAVDNACLSSKIQSINKADRTVGARFEFMKTSEVDGGCSLGNK